jgi:hypothetical protein
VDDLAKALGQVEALGGETPAATGMIYGPHQ